MLIGNSGGKIEYWQIDSKEMKEFTAHQGKGEISGIEEVKG